jgi:lipopolysaccharide transport system ATP-binding protein
MAKSTSGGPVIELRDVSRNFIIRHKGKQGLWSLLHGRDATANEFWALRGIDLTLQRGARIGIMGRNGAGKSTLLRIIAGVLQPTTGKVTVRGRVDALMSLGMGFHPEVSGRQNVIGSLAYRGITGRKAEKYADEVIEFAELEEFADLPLKAYSSGMSARLGFSAATTIEPDILIIDEVLGAGDAYFASKSFDRMRRLTQNGATVLFVSHDIGSVEKLCTEAVWLERGEIKQSGQIDVISLAYARQIREQDIVRLRARNSMISVNNFKALRSRRDTPFQVIARLVTEAAVSVDASACSLARSGQVVASVKVGHPQDTAVGEDAAVLVDPNVGQWTKPFTNVETRFHRSLASDRGRSGAVYFNVSILEPDANWELCWTIRGGECRIEVFDGIKYVEIERFKGSDRFVAVTARIPQPVIEDYLSSEGISVGSAVGIEPVAVRDAETITDSDVVASHLALDVVRFENAKGEECSYFKSFDELRVRLSFSARKDVHSATFVVCFYREGMCAFQSLSDITTGLAPNIPAGTSGEAVLTVPRLPLGRGHYLVSVAVYPQSIHEERSGDHIAYALLDRRFQIRVEQPEGGLIDLGMARGDVGWSVTTHPSAVVA